MIIVQNITEADNLCKCKIFLSSNSRLLQHDNRDTISEAAEEGIDFKNEEREVVDISMIPFIVVLHN